MRKSYLLVYSDSLGTRDEIKDCLNNMPEIIHWRYDIPQCFYIVSEEDATVIANKLRELRGNKGRFIISEITVNRQGWLPRQSWYLINNKKHMSKDSKAQKVLRKIEPKSQED
jgi:hypothetical protein